MFPPPIAQSRSGGGGGGLKKVVLVAGGMGINPLMSMLSFIGEQGAGPNGLDGVEVRMLYTVHEPFGIDGGGGAGAREGAEILFLERIVGLFESGRVKGKLGLFLTGGGERGGVEKQTVSCSGSVEVPFLRRRVTVGDVEEAVGDDKEAVAVYVCGVPSMTDEFVESLTSPHGLGMDPARVLFEKWW